MLENLFNLIKEQASDTVINNPAIPNEKNDSVIAEATHSIAGGLQNELAGGGLQNVLSMFGGGNTNNSSLLSNPIVASIISNFKGKLSGNFGLQENQASGIANNLIPAVLSNLVNKTNDPNNNSFDINSIIGSLSGGNSTQASPAGGSFDFQNILSGLTGGGLDANNDGQVGIDDIISKVSGGAQQQQAQNSGGLMDMIKGFLK